MATTYLICAAIGGTLMVCQFLMTLFGLGGGYDFAGGDPVDFGGHDGVGESHVGHGDESSWFLGILTFRTISAGMAFFGLVGMIGVRSAPDESLRSLLLAVGAGMAAVLLVHWVMKQIVNLNMDGTVRIGRAVGCRGTVYVPIRGADAGHGKIQVSVMNRTMEYKATSKQPLPTGANIVVVAVVNSDTLEVTPAED